METSDSVLKLLYFFDPLCGWCYAFGSEILKTENTFQGKLNIIPICGGMILRTNTERINGMSDYILRTIPIIESKNETRFGSEFIKRIREKNMISHSETAAIAMCVFKSMNTKNVLSFAHDLHKKHFIEGHTLLGNQTYQELCQKYKLDEPEFMKRLQSPEFLDSAHAEFNYVRKSGVQGFPSVIAQYHNENYLLTNGFVTSDHLNKKINQLIS